ncbi:10 kDa heat shock protein, mitochondrial-like [Eupeodes corollae]|uniref:10 kDa heat shock protein, mitochondrial-like n=1 Tax=Eupeodes corollae TaxID=290404 RepID=UPI0024903A6C|nr:10 kDa heat shock protein, mitochondrial-like [Eupeodes corollae]
MNSMKRVIPLLDRILVRRAEQIATSKGGIMIPEKSQAKAQEALVIAVGPGARNSNGNHVPVAIKEGDKVLLPQFGGTKLEIDDTDNKEYILLRESEILAKIV